MSECHELWHEANVDTKVEESFLLAGGSKNSVAFCLQLRETKGEHAAHGYLQDVFYFKFIACNM